ncbi:MAG: class I SAM-dependent methyltransferase [Archangiaceae bacterium]|nr:class I SAM-dependent methyltransferase [Archangiaceae bacterium]
MLASPCCRAPLDDLSCRRCGRGFARVAGVPVLRLDGSSAAIDVAEARYAAGREPWDYGHSAAEVQKYDLLELLCARVLGGASLAVDIGCSSGLLAERLTQLTSNVAAIDLSVTTAARVKQRLGERVTVAAASALALPFADGSVDLAVLSDGLISWELGVAERAAAVAETHRALKSSGTAIFMEYLNPRRHHELLDAVATRFEVRDVIYLHDRLWYVAESASRVLKGTALYQALDRSLAFADALKSLGRRLGPRGSKHLCVVVRKVAAPATAWEPHRLR